MTRIRISHSWRTIRGAHIRIVHRRRVAVTAPVISGGGLLRASIVPAIVISFRSWVAPSHGQHSPLSASLTEVF